MNIVVLVVSDVLRDDLRELLLVDKSELSLSVDVKLVVDKVGTALLVHNVDVPSSVDVVNIAVLIVSDVLRDDLRELLLVDKVELSFSVDIKLVAALSSWLVLSIVVTCEVIVV